MCTVSNIGSGWGGTFPSRYPWIQPYIPATNPIPVSIPGVSKEEFDRLKKEVVELRKLLAAAKAFDAATGQPDCEVDEKVALIKRIAEFVDPDPWPEDVLVERMEAVFLALGGTIDVGDARA